jgi:hypothetical protein
MTDETGGKPTEPTPLIAVPDLTELLAAAEECAGKLEASMGEAPDRVAYPHYHRSYERDMAPVRRLRAAVARVRGE